MRRLVVIPVVVLLIAFSFEGDVPAAETPVLLPNESASLKFVVLGDFGTGRRGQYALAAAMARVHEDFRFDVVVTVGDNLYGLERPADFKRKFEDPHVYGSSIVLLRYCYLRMRVVIRGCCCR